MVSLSNKGKGGLALLYHPSLTLKNLGTLALGQTAWAQLEIGSSIISIAIIYASISSSRECTFLWHQLKALLQDGQWIFLGDFNMTKDP